MSTQTITWIALPNGVANGKLKLSVFVTPQLVPDAASHPTLGTPGPGFPDFLDWPKAVKNIRFDVAFGSSAPITRVAPTSAAPRSDLWTALFGPSTPVAPYAFTDQSQRTIRSYPLPTVRDALKSAYIDTALKSPSDPPGYEDLGWREGDGGISTGTGWSLIRGANGKQTRQINGLLEDNHAISVADLSGNRLLPGSEFAQAELFHIRPDQQQPTTAAPAAPTLDFHSAWSALGDYPGLMRMLGIVFDIVLPVPSLSGDTLVSVAPSAGTYVPAAGPAVSQLSPATECTIGAGVFAARSAQPGILPGYVSLRNGYDVIEFDVDGHALKAFRFGDSTEATGEHRLPVQQGKQKSATLFPPALRGAGLAVAQIDRAVALSDALQHHTDLDTARTNSQSVVLQRRDVIKGFTVDVWSDADKAWHTLCARTGVYDFLKTKKIVKITDEASTRLAGTSNSTDPSDDFYLHEIVFRWDGWSLAAPRPGKAIVKDSTGAQGVASANSSAGPDFPLEVSFTPAPGSLPRLRYGTSYRFRVRAVDLAGNAAPLSAAPDDFAGTGATDLVRYGRFEPVAVPFVLPRLPKTAGESPERLVIRSNYNAASTADCERHIAPAKVVELMAEEHGLWDAANGKPKSTDYNLIAKHESGSYDNLGAPDPNGGGTRFYNTDNPGVPYIPDPIARGAVLQGLPGAGALFKVPFAAPKSTGTAPHSPFPNGYSFRLAVVEGTGAPTFDPKKRVLTVRLPKAAFTRVKLSSYVDAADLPLLGFWGWLEDELSSAQLAAQQQLIVNGQQFAVTPYRELTLVHAVRQPLTAPKFTNLAAVRTNVGQTDVTFTGTVSFDRPSTQKIDVVSSWDEYVDVPSTSPTALPTDNPPAAVPSTARAFELITELDKPGNSIDLSAGFPAPSEGFADTKHRMVTYTAVATTRFQDYFVETKQVALGDSSTAVSVSPAGIVEQSEVLRNVASDPKVDSTITYTRGQDYTVDYAAGTITALASLANKQVHVAYVAPPVTRSSAEQPTPVVVDVKSTARPAAPNVRYVVPTFGWETSSDKTSQTRTRVGYGLRVYLDRPWWSSGQDEQLGVLTATDSTAVPLPDTLSPYVTVWGADPIWQTGALASKVRASAFGSAATIAEDVTLAESSDTVNVAAHDVGYDAQRGLWYADVTVNGADVSYSPFIRLALARYQAHSLVDPSAKPPIDLRLSHVVLAEFTKLSPTRTATVVTTGNPTEVVVHVSGLAPGGGAFGGGTYVTVSVQTAVTGVQGELGWADTPSVQQLTPQAQGDGTTVWSNAVNLPASRGSTSMRLVIREYELYATDPQNPDIGTSSGSRLVYMDTIEI
jgi:hypothetical protein